MKKVGIIDLGSNSVRISVVSFEAQSYRTVFMDRCTVKLSENMNSDMYLKPDAIERTIKVLSDYKKIFDSMSVEQIYAVTTAAVRKAKNGEGFIATVKEETGIQFEIIDGKKEAEFDYLAVKHSMNLSDCIIMDIGGGSTEIIGIRSGELNDFISIPLASRNITEIYLSPETPQKVTDAEASVFKHFNSIDWLKKYKGVPIVGLGGCLREIGKVDSNKKNKPFKSGYKVDIESVKTLYNEIKKMPIEKRIEVIGESKGDIILGGAMPFMSVLKIIEPSYLCVSDKGVRDGIVYSIIEKI